MRKLLSVHKNAMPDECYSHWYNNIKAEYRSTFDAMVTEMANSEKVIQMEYIWNHPQNGELLIRCSGRCADKYDEIIVFEGFHRVINDL